MEFLIAGLLVLNLAVTLVSVYLLRRETERAFRGVGQLLGEAKASLTGVNASQAELMHKLVRMETQRGRERSEDAAVFENFQTSIYSALSGMEDQRKKDAEALNREIVNRADADLSREADTVKSLSGLWKESEKQTAALQSLLAREDVSELVKKLEAMPEDPAAGLSREQETAMSKAMEDGIASILAYTSGKVPGVELRL